ncbi:hypothetical protein PM082_016567 [Marasmius tenuissimus]|nr:hypothetical protein PM082_016567 [Marasmius tenuissimus]
MHHSALFKKSFDVICSPISPPHSGISALVAIVVFRVVVVGFGVSGLMNGDVSSTPGVGGLVISVLV